jgi:hypothetical protein
MKVLFKVFPHFASPCYAFQSSSFAILEPHYSAEAQLRDMVAHISCLEGRVFV